MGRWGVLCIIALTLTITFVVVVAAGYDAPTAGDMARAIALGGVPGLAVSGGLGLGARSNQRSDLAFVLALLVLLGLAFYLYIVGGYAIAGDD